MTKVKRRAAVVFILIAVMLAGLGIYIYNYINNGDDWAAFSANQAVYNNGNLAVGIITDRDGEILAKVENGERIYADSSLLRKSTLHVIGDRWGNIGTGALYLFNEKLTGFDIVNGTYSKEGEGGEVILAINAELNEYAYQALDSRKGTVLVCDCDTGEIICMVSSPSYDPDNVPESFDTPEYEGVYLNRAISSAYTPGSVFKLITMAAAVENIPDLDERIFYCEGSYETGGDEIICTNWHGELTAEEALAVSCNCVFGQIAEELGGELLLRYAEDYGFTEALVIDNFKTVDGNFDVGSNSYEVAWSGIGQYNDLVNPSAMLRFVAAIANGGIAPKFTILKSDGQADTERIMKSSTAEILSEMMNYNVHRTYGTYMFPDMTAYAKSGTAEQDGDVVPHSWFVGYCEKDSRTLAFVVVIENGGSGVSAAGSVASLVMIKAFELCK